MLVHTTAQDRADSVTRQLNNGHALPLNTSVFQGEKEVAELCD
jgi:hypothetical protein